jgi:uncharacterized repeat protein (TIGR03803 family)
MFHAAPQQSERGGPMYSGTRPLRVASTLRCTTLVGMLGLSLLVFGIAAPDFAQTYTEAVIYSFLGGADGANASRALVQATDGNLYGTTGSGGLSNMGTVFQIANPYGVPKESVLYSFTGGADGANPAASLIQATDGNLYGTTKNGGTTGYGTVFRISGLGGTATESVIYTFTGGADGSGPTSRLLEASDGSLYGTTDGGGSTNCIIGCGAVFRISNLGGSPTETTIYTFGGGSDGGNPYSSVIQASDGNLYGAAADKGVTGFGLVYRISNLAGTPTETVLYNFAGGADGESPEGSVIQASDGNLYGTTLFGGVNNCSSGCGTVYTIINPSTSPTERLIYRFTGGADGWGEWNSVIQAADGNLYGTTLHGGASDKGVVFEIVNPTSSPIERILYSFTGGADGGVPGTLIQASDGRLFGTTYSGGTGNVGVVFSLTAPLSNSPLASFSISPNNPAASQAVLFTDSSRGATLSWAWDFNGDGVTDSTAQNPTWTFNSPGPYPVTLTVSNPYGTSHVTHTVNVGGNGGPQPFVTSMSRSYPGVFLAGTSVANVFTLGVNWQGSPGTVAVAINGRPWGTLIGDASGAQATFQMAMAFVPSWTSSVVTFTPTNAAGTAGVPWTENVFVLPYPTWLTDVLNLGHGSVTTSASAGVVTTIIHAQFPDPPLVADFPVPDFVPYIGGNNFGLMSTFAEVSGSVLSSGSGSFSVYGQTGFEAMGNSISGTVSGSGHFTLISPQGLNLTSASVGFTLNDTLSRDVGIVEAIPALQSLEIIPVLGYFVRVLDSHTSLNGQVSPSLAMTAQFAQDPSSGKLQFASGTGSLGAQLTGTLSVDVLEHLTGRLWLSGTVNLALAVPTPPQHPGLLIRSGEIGLQAGADLTLDYLFGTSCANAVANAGCSWTPDGGLQCPPPTGTASTNCTAQPIRTEYSRYGQYSQFKAEHKMLPSSSKVPVSIQQTSFITNLFPGAEPNLTKVGTSGRLLLWEQQNTSLPPLQSTDIAWSYVNGSSWSVPALIAADTQVELDPVAGVDMNGNVVAAWLRIKDPAFVTPIPGPADLPLFYNDLEVVTATFNPTTQTWSPITQLTNDSAMDTDLVLSADAAGNVMLTWLTNPSGEFYSSFSYPSTLNYSTWNGSAWSVPASIDVNLAGVGSHAAEINGSAAFVILPVEPDPATPNSGVLNLYTWNGTSWSAASTFAGGGVENRLPTAAYDSAGQGHVVWVQGSDLVHATLSNPTPSLVRSQSTSIAFQKTRLLSSPLGNLTIVWSEIVDNGPAALFAAIFDTGSQTWSADRRLTADGLETHDYHGFYATDGSLHLAFLSTAITRTTVPVVIGGQTWNIANIPQEAQTDLNLLDHSLITDLAVQDSDLSVAPPLPAAGDSVNASLLVHNAGDFTVVPTFDVSLYVGNPVAGGVLVGTASIPGPFAAGAAQAVQFAFTYPATPGDVYAVVDPGNVVPEFTKANNTAHAYLTDIPPVILVTATPTSGPVPLTVNFDASPSFDPNGDSFVLTWSFGDGSPNATGLTVSHTFQTTGVFPVAISATDSRGATSLSTVMITVNCAGAGGPPPSSTITAPPVVCTSSTGNAASVPGAGAGATYAWTITNGTITSGASTSAITFDVGSTTNVQLGVTVQDSSGCASSSSVTIELAPALSGAVVSLSGASSVCTNGSGGLATVAPQGGGSATYQWGYRTTTGGTVTLIPGETAGTYLLKAADLPGTGGYLLVCTVSATCGGPVVSNEVAVTVTSATALPAPVVSAPASVPTNTPGLVASVANHAGSTYSWTISNGVITAGQGSSQITFTSGTAGPMIIQAVETDASGCSTLPGMATVSSTLYFHTIAPCRVIDTRRFNGVYGAPALQGGGAQRSFEIAGQCGIPPGAGAVAVNLTAVAPPARGDLRLFPAGTPTPAVSTINFNPGNTRANNAILSLAGDPSGGLTIRCDMASGTLNVLVDVMGYFQ